jgi:tetratricopeptide (TPR) repeat protein
MDTVEKLLLPVDFSDPFNFRRLSARGERQLRWRRALDTIETIARFVDTDTLAKAYYFYGRGMIFQDMAWSGMFIRDSSIMFARLAIRNFETYIQNRIGNPAPVYESLAMLYLDFLSDPNTALRRINRSLALDPRRVWALVSKAQILRTLGRHAEACETLRQAREIESLQIIDMMISSSGCP